MRLALCESIVLVAFGLAGACLLAPRPCAAQGATSSLPAWLDELTLNGFLAANASYNFNLPASGTNQFRVFDFDDATFKLDVLELVAQKAAQKPRESGFRLDLALGGSVPRVSAAAGLFRDDAGKAGDFDLQQAFVSYVVPLGSGLRIDAGKFVTHHGYEVIDGYDGWNDNATRSFMFGYAIPFTHVGARAAYTFSPQVSSMAMIVNGWDVARDNNRSKSIGGQLTLTPSAPLTVILNGMIGPEKAGNEKDRRTMLDLIAIWKVCERVTLGANADHGTEEHDLPAPGPTALDASWNGVAAYARFAFCGRYALSLRGEHFEDLDGVRTGTAQMLNAITLTPEMRVTPHLLLRGDLRVDRSNHPVFEKRGGSSDTQPTVLFETIYSF